MQIGGKKNKTKQKLQQGNLHSLKCPKVNKESIDAQVFRRIRQILNKAAPSFFRPKF